jgi:hypothetical protein
MSTKRFWMGALVLTLTVFQYACGKDSQKTSLPDAAAETSGDSVSNSGPAGRGSTNSSSSSNTAIGGSQNGPTGHENGRTVNAGAGGVAITNTDTNKADTNRTDAGAKEPRGEAGTDGVLADAGEQAPGEQGEKGEESGDSKKPSWAGCPGKQPKPGGDCSKEDGVPCIYGEISCTCVDALWVCSGPDGILDAGTETESGGDAMRGGRFADGGMTRGGSQRGSGSKDGG